MANLATDSAKELHETVGDDATATFESDPTFVDSNPGTNGSSDNVEQQRDTDDLEDSDEEIEDEDDSDEDDEEIEDDEDELAASPALHTSALDDEDDDEGDVDPGVDEDAIEDDDMDTDQVAERALRMQAFYARRSQDVAARMRA